MYQSRGQTGGCVIPQRQVLNDAGHHDRLGLMKASGNDAMGLEWILQDERRREETLSPDLRKTGGKDCRHQRLDEQVRGEPPKSERQHDCEPHREGQRVPVVEDAVGSAKNHRRNRDQETRQSCDHFVGRQPWAGGIARLGCRASV